MKLNFYGSGDHLFYMINGSNEFISIIIFQNVWYGNYTITEQYPYEN